MATATSTSRRSQTPLYKGHANVDLGQDYPECNQGLRFDKYPSRWKGLPTASASLSDKVEFDKASGEWLKSFCKSEIGNKECLHHFGRRQDEMVTSLGGATFLVKNESRFVTGMGRSHPKENGFRWHHTLGTPYLPGSGLKGMLKTWYREEVCFDWDDDEEKDDKHWKPKSEELLSLFRALFGGDTKDAHVGGYLLFDVIPVEPVQLVVEVMTPHYGKYYSDENGSTIPGDWLSPVPITYLAVKEGQTWQVAIAPRPPREVDSTEHSDPLPSAPPVEEVVCKLKESLLELGLGAKTNIGMGRFVPENDYQPSVDVEDPKVAKIQRPKVSDSVNAKLEKRAIKRSGKGEKLQWTATHGDTGMTGPIQNATDVPADANEGDEVELIVAIINERQIAFKYPTEAEKKRVATQRGKKRHNHHRRR